MKGDPEAACAGLQEAACAGLQVFGAQDVGIRAHPRRPSLGGFPMP